MPELPPLGCHADISAERLESIVALRGSVDRCLLDYLLFFEHRWRIDVKEIRIVKERIENAA